MAVLVDAPVEQLPAPAMMTASAVPIIGTAATALGMTEVELPSGVKLRLKGDVEEALRRVLSAPT